MLHLGQWIIDVEWKKGPRPAVAAPTSPVKFDYFSLPVALDISIPVSALQRPWAWLEQEEQEHLLQGNRFNLPGGPEYTGAEFREGFPPMPSAIQNEPAHSGSLIWAAIAVLLYDQVIRRSSCACIRHGCVGTTRTLKP